MKIEYRPHISMKYLATPGNVTEAEGKGTPYASRPGWRSSRGSFCSLVILKGPEKGYGYAVAQELQGCWTSILSGKGGLLLVCE